MAYSEYSHRHSRKRPADDYDGAPRYKRGRYSDPGPRGRDHEQTTEEKLESLIMRVGEKSFKSLEKNLESLAGILQKEMSSYKEKILRTICNCVTKFTEKTTTYSTLVGLLNASKFDIGEEFIDMLVEELKSALAFKQFEKARKLVCFLADLVNSKVVASSSIVNVFDTFATVTYEPNIPQIRSDWYVYMVLSAVPWVGHELQEKKKIELERLFLAIDNYMTKRPLTFLPAFQVWTSSTPYPQRDYLELLWEQVKGMKENEWKESILLRPYRSQVFESAAGAYPHTLPNIQVPNHTEDCIYPLPFAVFHLFTNDDLQCTPGPDCVLPLPETIDRFLMEETIRCIVNSHENNRKECAAALTSFAESAFERNKLPAEYIITEVLFGYILQLPHPQQVVVYYSSVFIELCKSNPAVYPQILSQATKLLFNNVEEMNYVCVNRFAQWFAYHLSNYKYQWEWSLWSSSLQVPSDHVSALFVKEVFSRCIRLSCYDDFAEQIPESFSSLLPVEPMPTFKFSSDDPNPPPESPVASQLLEAIRAKEPAEKLGEILDSLSSIDPDNLLESKVSVLTQCVLHVGSKTITHCFLALFKFRSLFLDLVSTDEAKLVCLKNVAEFYACNPQLHTLVVDKLIRTGIVDPMAVVNWLFTPEVTPHLSKQYLWDILDQTVQKSNRTYYQSVRELADTKEKLKKLSDLDEVAMGSEGRQELEGKIEELEDKVEDCEKMQRDVFIVICQRLIGVMSEHLAHCDQEGVDYETTWFLYNLDYLRQLLIQNFSEMMKYYASLETTAFTADIDSRILEVFQQFQTLL